MKVNLSEAGEVLAVSGNTCPRGKTYAESECTHPVRTVTSTVICEGGAIVSVKTAMAIPKEKMFEVMAELRTVIAPAAVKIGDVIIANVASTGVAIVASSNP
jgi:CxxC motif-containing protein